MRVLLCGSGSVDAPLHLHLISVCGRNPAISPQRAAGGALRLSWDYPCHCSHNTSRAFTSSTLTARKAQGDKCNDLHGYSFEETQLMKVPPRKRSKL